MLDRRSGSTSSLRLRIALSRRRARAWRPTGPRLKALLRSISTSYIALGITLYILPGRQSSGPLAVLGLVMAVAVVGVLLRPLLAGLAVVLGSFGLLAVGVLSQAIILDVAIALAPDVDFTGWPEVLLVSWVAAAVAAIANWLFDLGSDEAFLDQLLGRAVRVAHRHADGAGEQLLRTGEKRLLVVQLDGVGEALLGQAITAGQMPTLSSWLRTGTHSSRGWHTGLPSTTPAGQAVLMYGDVTQVPAFRWFEKESGSMLVTNHPRDAAEIERRLSHGDGLLADGGVSVSNLFSGDATTSLLTMSDARLPPRIPRGLASLASTRAGLVRSLVVFVGDVITELIQGRRQRHRDVQPRVRRTAIFALQRAVTTAVLRDLAVEIVAEQIACSAAVIFVDFLDYDEVAHHAGPSRPESMRTLDQLDRVVGFFTEIIRETGQDYEIVIVSDHGQAQGATFAQLCGAALPEVIAELAADAGPSTDSPSIILVGADDAPAEPSGATTLLLNAIARSDELVARAISRAHHGVAFDSGGKFSPGRVRSLIVPGAPPQLIVAAGGNLAHLYLADIPGRVDRERIDERYPRLIDGLAQHPFIGAVMVFGAQEESWLVLGASGWRLLTEAGTVGGEGMDPIAVYGPHAASDLRLLAERHHVGDVVLLGRFDPHTGEVAAFEELVGSHGGLGGGQTGAVLIHPSDWQLPSGSVLSGTDVHELLLRHLPARATRAQA
jgi:hypothetical protein